MNACSYFSQSWIIMLKPLNLLWYKNAWEFSEFYLCRAQWLMGTLISVWLLGTRVSSYPRPYRDRVGPSKLLAKHVSPINELVQGSYNCPKWKHRLLLVAPSKISCYRDALIDVYHLFPPQTEQQLLHNNILTWVWMVETVTTSTLNTPRWLSTHFIPGRGTWSTEIRR